MSETEKRSQPPTDEILKLSECTQSLPTCVIHEPEDDFPDGGLRAWLVVLGGAATAFTTFGFVNSWGVFQTYYENVMLPHTSPSTIAWIGSIQYALVYFPGLIIGRLFDIGYFRIPFACASILIVTATVLTAECKQYWQFLLCQGISVGIASGVLFLNVISVIGHWFKKRRSLALGINAVGASIGGTVLPIAARNLIQRVGFQWAMRILALILFFALALSNLTLRRRLPPSRVTKTFISWQSFRNPAFSVYCLAGLTAFLGIYTLLTYVESSAIVVGVPDHFAFYLIAIANAVSGFGRVFGGLAADKYGLLNVMVPLTALTGMLTYIWPHVHSQGGLTAIAVAYGFTSATFVSQLPAPIMAMGDAYNVGQRVGLASIFFASGALAGPPISGAINAATRGFVAVGTYAGSAVMVSVALMFITRYLLLGQFFGKV